MLRTALIFAPLLFVTSTVAYSQSTLYEPSFGLNWNETEAEFKAAFDVSERKVEGDLVILTTSTVNELLPSNTDTLQAIFWNDRLVKFQWTSENFTDDLYGSIGKEAYSRLSKQLTDKLGQGNETTVVGLDLWDEADEFYQCLNYTGCGAWATIWTNPTESENLAILSLEGLNRGVGYLRYGMEHPDWYRRSEVNDSGDVSKF
jgi:hypothetical protein